MNLSFRQQRMAMGTGPWALLALVGLCMSGAQPALAQDMTFDLEEVEEEQPEGESQGELEGQAGGEASASGGVDIFQELSQQEDDSLGAAGNNAPKEKEVIEEIYAVQRMHVLRRGRFELAPSVAFSVSDPYTSRTAISAAANYWITNVLAIGANFLWYQGLETESDLNFSVRRFTRLEVPITEYQLGSHLNFTYVPLYGKFNMFNDFIFQWDSYLVGGVGVMRTRPIAEIDSAVRKFDFDFRVSFNVGVGIRVFITKWLSVFAELRDYIFLEKLENLDVALENPDGTVTSGDRNDPSSWIDKSSELTNNVSAHIGISMFFPFNFEYRYPK